MGNLHRPSLMQYCIVARNLKPSPDASLFHNLLILIT